MTDEFEEEAVYADNADEDEDESAALVEDDEMTAEEEGFLRGYEEANKPVSRKDEAEEEELE